MGCTCVGLALLLWFAGPLDAQNEATSCTPPHLRFGYFVPEAESYNEGAQITYTCEEGRKPAAEGWWAKSSCQNSNWFPKPECIAKGACLTPEVPNGKFTPSEMGWYRPGSKIRVTCDEGFMHQNFNATAVCKGGSWSSIPVCIKRPDACEEPPQIPHAVVINRTHREVFPENSDVLYQCRVGYGMEGMTDVRTLTCIGGKWSGSLTCTALCVLNAANYLSDTVKVSRVHYLIEGETKEFPCIWSRDPHTSTATCTRGKVTLSRCCRTTERLRKLC